MSAADFFANHPFHVRIENFSRRIFAPSQDGTFRESKWFYERARGQYQDARAHLSKGDRKKFDLEYPRRQLFSKTDLAKFQMVWEQVPHTVSKGAQKNFMEFASRVSGSWEKNEALFNERYYHHSVAKAIVFRRLERLVPEQAWYAGGYRANIVAYAIAKIAHDVAEMGSVVDFDRIWREQSLSQAMDDASAVAAKAAHDVLESPPDGVRNVTEWAKKSACWTRLRSQPVTWPGAWLAELVGADAEISSRRAAVKDQRMLNGVEAQAAVVNRGAELWERLGVWGRERKLLTAKEQDILAIAAAIPARIPTEKQCTVVLKALGRMTEEGFDAGETRTSL